jgi:hypothetical protein
MQDSTHRVFCDESCHLENDGFPCMVLGYIKVRETSYADHKSALSSIKHRHQADFDLKWNKVSKGKLPLYTELIDYFFDSDLEFRAVLVKYKDELDHDQFNGGDHDNFYYKMVYYLIDSPYSRKEGDKIRTFLDIKDTRGRERLHKIRHVFANKYWDKNGPFAFFQHIRSEDSVFIQLADLLIGAIGYKSRGLMSKPGSSLAKYTLIHQIEKRSGYRIDSGTPPWELKFNVFNHQPRTR